MINLDRFFKKSIRKRRWEEKTNHQMQEDEMGGRQQRGTAQDASYEFEMSKSR